MNAAGKSQVGQVELRCKGPYRAHRQRQRARILAAAEELFDHRGIDRALMGEIVEATGIRASTLYEYFASKEEIVWALVEERFREAETAIRAKLEAVKGGFALDRITALLEAFREELV